MRQKINNKSALLPLILSGQALIMTVPNCLDN